MTARVVGVCAFCGGDVVRLASDGELASCPCGKASIPDAMLDSARRMNPQRERDERRAD